MKASPESQRRIGSLIVLCALAVAALLVAGYDQTTQELTVRVTDQEGNPLPGAMVGLSENKQTLLADQEGRVMWTGLNEEQASLVVAAQGYVLYTTVISLARGVNEATLALERKSHDVPYQPVGP
jgi:hypothetical protein